MIVSFYRWLFAHFVYRYITMLKSDMTCVRLTHWYIYENVYINFMYMYICVYSVFVQEYHEWFYIVNLILDTRAFVQIVWLFVWSHSMNIGACCDCITIRSQFNGYVQLSVDNALILLLFWLAISRLENICYIALIIEKGN